MSSETMNETNHRAECQARKEFHVIQHTPPVRGERRHWGATGISFDGDRGRELAVARARELQNTAPAGYEYSVQRYEYGIGNNYRPKKTKVWRNGVPVDQ